MLTVLKNGVPTGTQYYTNEKKFYEHHEQYGEVLIDYDMPIIFDSDGVLITPFTLTDAEIQASAIRAKREVYCFELVNRGAVWYDTLAVEQRAELTTWYKAWLTAPDTLVVPEDLAWLN